jgi:class 3 adenylate cyclase
MSAPKPATSKAPHPGKPNSHTLQFDSTASEPRHGLVVIYDLEGFSRFFNQPDVQDYVPVFINHVSKAISVCIYGGEAYWLPRRKSRTLESLAPAPVHEKYLGDGAMYIWLDSDGERVSKGMVSHLCNRLWNLKSFFSDVVRAAADELPVIDIPQRIRFGVAWGTIYELTRAASQQKEYIGFCINLASRLQKYCPDLGFIASARVGLSRETLDAHAYIKVIAKAIKGFPREVVIVDKDEWAELDAQARDELFEPL